MSANVSTPSLDLPSFELPGFQYAPETAQKMMNLWVGASSVLWAPFWAASSAGLGLWMLREGAARAAPLSDDLPPAFRSWMTAHSLWLRNIAPVAEAVEDATEATIELMTDMPDVALKTADKVVETAKMQAAAMETAAEKITETVKETVAETPVPEIVAPVAAEKSEPEVPPVPVPEVAAVVAAAPVLQPTKEAAALAVSKTKKSAPKPTKPKGPATKA